LFTKSDLKNETDNNLQVSSIKISKTQNVNETQQVINSQKLFNGEQNLIQKNNSSGLNQLSNIKSIDEKTKNPFKVVKDLQNDKIYNSTFNNRFNSLGNSQNNLISESVKLIPSRARNKFGITYTSGSKGILRVQTVGDKDYQNHLIIENEPILIPNKTICPSSDQSKIFELLSIPNSNNKLKISNETLNKITVEEEVSVIVNNLSPFSEEKDNIIDLPQSNNDEKERKLNVLDYSFQEGNNFFTVEKVKSTIFHFRERNEKLLKNNLEKIKKTLQKINLSEDILDMENIVCYYKEFVNQVDKREQGEIVFSSFDES
jgi:hemin uptake protein HemP